MIIINILEPQCLMRELSYAFTDMLLHTLLFQHIDVLQSHLLCIAICMGVCELSAIVMRWTLKGQFEEPKERE